MKLGIIGSGNVGEIVAYTAACRGLVNEVVFNDIIKQRAISQAMDLNDGRAFYPHDVKATAGEYNEMGDCDIIVVCSGQIPTSGDRLHELQLNQEAVGKYVEEVVASGFDGIFIVVTNPCDVITYQVYKHSGFPAHKVIGSGTALDSARLNVVIADHIGVSPKSVHGNVLGEHGESQFVPWSQVRIGNETIDRYAKKHPELFKNFDRDKIENDTRKRGWDIFQGKASTQYGIANTVNNLISAIKNDDQIILNASAYLDGQYGLEDLYISTPIRVGKNGIEEIIELPLTERELERFNETAEVIKCHIEKLS
ncbi:MAG: L-lactate dehydrogenase [Tissierellia bacterium]|nr:L-lactate dehydrogenase [Tissierellia bacterium]